MSQSVSPQRTVPPVPRRSVSQDSSANNVDKTKPSSKSKPTSKKGSSHADVIDRMDFSGVGPSCVSSSHSHPFLLLILSGSPGNFTVFHHDGPFDACAPSRNRHRTKAPMFAWSGTSEADRDAFSAAREISGTAQNSPYPSTSVYVPYEAPKKKRDAIAEAWGIHEPEPFEDFSAGGGTSTRGADNGTVLSPRGVYNGSSRRAKDARDAREKYKEYLDEAPPPTSHRRQQRRPNIPPPQPIFVSETDAADLNPPSPTQPASPGGSAPKRTKSLMHRIRKMRDAPNVPAAVDEPAEYGNERDTSPSSSAENSAGSGGQVPISRPTHRAQNSFLGRLGRGANAGKDIPSPTSDTTPEPYVYVNEMPQITREKSLPATPGRRGVTPGENGAGGYFDAAGGGGNVGSPGGGGLGRKTSLLKKMKGVVKGTAAK